MEENKIYLAEEEKAFKYLVKNACKDLGLELIISPDCNLKCSYCYMHKHGKELFPEEINKKEDILKNLKRIVSKLVEEKTFLKNDIDIFSGEFFMLDYWEEVFDILYDGLKEFVYTKSIVIPSNFSFLTDEEKTKKIEEYIDKFKELGVRLALSASVDGKFLDNKQRKCKKESYYTDEFYDKVFSFVKKHRYGLHPMVSALNIEDWKDNYVWYMENIMNKFDMKDKEGAYKVPMMLEVRDNNWSKEKIELYCDWLTFIVDYDLKNIHKGNVKELAQRLFKTPVDDNKYVIKIKNSENDITYINKLYDAAACPTINTRISCSMQWQLVLRVADMSIVPCHRTMYPTFIYAKIEEDGKIKVNNLALASYLFSLNPTQGGLECYSCPIKDFCGKGCFGAQYEYTGEILKNCNTVCDFYFAKYKRLYEIFNKYDMWRLATEGVENKSFVVGVAYIKGIMDKVYGK